MRASLPGELAPARRTGLRAGTPLCFLALTMVVAVVACLALHVTPASAAEGALLPPDRTIYQKIELGWPTPAEWDVIQSLPDLEVMGVEWGVWVRFLSTVERTARLREAGLRPEVIEADLGAKYASQILAPGWGAFYTYSEAVDFLDSLHTAFPAITTAKFSLGTSLEGRTIWGLKVSDNPLVDEDEPEVLFDGVHHAREPITVSEQANFMRFLCGNYGTDPEATFLVDQREIFFVPVVNPDGYVWNETSQPDRMWRKNRRDNPGSCEGVDLNRNYGYQWGGPGSSGDYCDETYRGTAAFSEPETQVMRNFIVGRHFVTHNSYHSVAGLILYPWGYTETPPPDASTFASMANEMNRDSGYPYGSIGPTLYLASGGSCDWAYGEQTLKPKIFSFTTEVGGSDFWPAEGEISGLIAENLYSDIYLSLTAGAYVTAIQVAVTGGDGNGRLDPGEACGLVVTLKNTGVLATASSVNLTVSSDDPYVEIQDATYSYGTLGPGVSAANSGDPFELAVDAATPQGHVVTFQLTTTWSGQGQNEETAALTVGTLPVIVSDDFESGNHGWSQDPTHTASTGAWVIIDPNATDWQPGDDTTPAPGVNAWITGQNTSVGTDDVDGGISAMRSPIWDLSGYTSVKLMLNYFHGQRDAGGDAGDFFRIDLSNNGGTTYPANLVLWGDATHYPNWTPLEVDLEDHLPLTSQMRLRFQAADGTTVGEIIEGGLDDLVILNGGSGNRPPTAPGLFSPPNGGSVPTITPSLVVENASDPDSDPLTYGFRVYADSLLTSLVRSVNGVAPGMGGLTSWKVSPWLSPGKYWWRAFADDGEERGLFMAAASFTISAGADVASESPVTSFAVRPASPNPFAGQTMVHFSMPSDGRVRADVFDSQGRRVRSLYRGLMPAGWQTLTWDARDEAGTGVAPGVYFMQLETQGRQWTVKMTVVR